MSVINKMLRDLDQRKASGSPTTVAAPDTYLRAGTASVTPVQPRQAVRRTASPGRRVGAWIVVFAALAAAAVWWYEAELTNQTVPVIAPPSAVVRIPAPQALPASAAPPAMDVVAMVPEAAVSAVLVPEDRAVASSAPLTPPLPPSLRMEPTLKSSSLAKAQPPVTASGVAPASPEPTRREPTVQPTANTPTSTSDPTQLALRQQQAAKEAIAQAQSLWNTGSHDTAIDLMQGAVSVAEKTLASSPGTGNTQQLVMLVRELARMQLAEARPGAAWDLLVRLEPQIRNEPDLWAMRANAAQRLGRHQDSVLAYQTALQSRPNEQRWLLGAAVSLAAQGQTASAAEMAEKARAAGTVSREVLAYLRQMGVPIKD